MKVKKVIILSIVGILVGMLLIQLAFITIPNKRKNRGTDNISIQEAKYKIIEIDDCEYIYIHPYILIHKANCSSRFHDTSMEKLKKKLHELTGE